MVNQVAGFQTERGSIYAYDADGKTVRLKMSSGRGHGELHIPSVCVFVSPKGFDSISEHYFGFGHAENRIFIGYQKPGDKLLSPLLSPQDLPANSSVCLVVQNRKSGETLVGGSTTLVPAIGLHPVEKAYDDSAGTSHTHVGNKVVRIFASPAELMMAMRDAQSPNAVAAQRPGARQANSAQLNS